MSVQLVVCWSVHIMQAARSQSPPTESSGEGAAPSSVDWPRPQSDPGLAMADPLTSLSAAEV
jgi:hypothetical protein